MIKNLSKLLFTVAILFCEILTTQAQEIKLNDGPIFVHNSIANLLIYPVQKTTASSGMYVVTSISSTEVFRNYVLSYYDKSNNLVWDEEFGNIEKVYQVSNGVLVVHGEKNASAFNSKYFVTFLDEVSGKKTTPRFVYHKKDRYDELKCKYNPVTNQLVLLKYASEQKGEKFDLEIEVVNVSGTKASSEVISFENTGKKFAIEQTLIDTLNNKLIIQSSSLGKDYTYYHELLEQKITVISLSNYSKVVDGTFKISANFVENFSMELHNSQLHLFADCKNAYNTPPVGIVHMVFDYKTLNKESERLIVLDKSEALKFNERKPIFTVRYSSDFRLVHFTSDDEMTLMIKGWYNKLNTIEPSDLVFIKVGSNDVVKWVNPISVSVDSRPSYSIEARNDNYMVFFDDDKRNNDIRSKYGAKSQSRLKNMPYSINMAFVDAKGNITYKYLAEESKEISSFRGPWSIEDKWYYIEVRPKGVFQMRWFKLD